MICQSWHSLSKEKQDEAWNIMEAWWKAHPRVAEVVKPGASFIQLAYLEGVSEMMMRSEAARQ